MGIDYFLCILAKTEPFICLLFTLNVMLGSYFVNFEIIVTQKYLKMLKSIIVYI